jgi:hypothetical protein
MMDQKSSLNLAGVINGVNKKKYLCKNGLETPECKGLIISVRIMFMWLFYMVFTISDHQ